VISTKKATIYIYSHTDISNVLLAEQMLLLQITISNILHYSPCKALISVKIYINHMNILYKYIITRVVMKAGHGELLELRLLEKSARHDFIIARHHSSK
jgi:hypothetical protein